MILEGRFQVLEARTRELRPKTMKNHKNDENGQNVTFWGCRRKPQNRCFFSSRKPKWVCVICGVPLVMGVSEGGPLLGPLFGHFWGSKMTPFNPQMGLFTIVIWNRVVSEGCPKWPQKSPFFKNVKKCQKWHFLDTFWTPQNDILRQKWHFCHFGSQKRHLPMESSLVNDPFHRETRVCKHGETYTFF